MTKKEKIEVLVEIEKLPEHTMFLHTQIATGETNGKTFTVDQVLPVGGLCVTIGEWGENQRYIMRIKPIVSAMLDFHFEGGGKDIPAPPKEKTK